MAKQKSKWHTIIWDTKQYLKEMEQNSNKRMQIIALFAKVKNYHFDNYQQMQFFISRNQRPAKQLECFDIEKILTILNYLLESADFKVTLETVGKYIFEDIQQLKSEESIITLKSGEKIYDIKRLKVLEQEGKIKYDKDNWIEIL